MQHSSNSFRQRGQTNSNPLSIHTIIYIIVQSWFFCHSDRLLRQARSVSAQMRNVTMILLKITSCEVSYDIGRWSRATYPWHTPALVGSGLVHRRSARPGSLSRDECPGAWSNPGWFGARRDAHLRASFWTRIRCPGDWQCDWYQCNYRNP